jgi:hypothetical protein
LDRPEHPRTQAEQDLATMLVGLFLLYLVASTAVFISIQWALGFPASAMLTGTATFFVASGGGGAIIVLVRHNLTGFVIAVAIMVFWSFLLFGTDSATLIPTLSIAAAALYAAAAVTLLESFLRERVPQGVSARSAFFTRQTAPSRSRKRG